MFDWRLEVVCFLWLVLNSEQLPSESREIPTSLYQGEKLVKVGV